MIMVLFYRKGIMGDKELSIDSLLALPKKLKRGIGRLFGKSKGEVTK